MKKKVSKDNSTSPHKKIKLEDAEKTNAVKKDVKFKVEKGSKFEKNGNKNDPTSLKDVKAKKFQNKVKMNATNGMLEKPEDWNKFKKEKKELKLKRKQTRGNFDVVTRAKSIGEKLRQKTLKGGEEERNKLINELHSLLKGKGEYAKFVLAHDTARIVQWLLKYSSDIVVSQISQELTPVTVDMLQSKYGVFCVKRLLKYGSSDTKKAVIDKMLGHAVKLTSHSISASIVETAYSTWASPQQKQFLAQEFYGDLYKNSKDKNVKHLRDSYKDNQSLKAGILRATKENILKIINKGLLDSGLVQSVISQFITECTVEDKTEMISLLAPHIVVISNSKDGARAAMQCIWHGSNKDRKVIMKTLKEHIVDLSKHEHGHCTVITLIDTADDTVLLNKVILSEILKNIKDLSQSEWGSKVLLYLIDPSNATIFHPLFQNELKSGRETCTSKKSLEIRRQEILQYSLKSLLDLVKIEPEFWLTTSSLALQMLIIVKSGSGEDLKEAYKSIVGVICDVDWKIKENDAEIDGIEHAGFHMVLKKLAQHDKVNLEAKEPTFGEFLIEKLDDTLLQMWLKLNRGCFLLVILFENGSKDTQNGLKKKLKKHSKLLEKQSTQGAKILLKKLT
ncbi:unnamed protein product [Brassicogethes aeneus]|uniref:CPL domain-containing protein n=1 Tax=Brassicogethes aeneus TaxID=1431903 RepID=A0A9P0BK04_BRAAE|nr:unnamed protein product [Brassicogethes aeneus]